MATIILMAMEKIILSIDIADGNGDEQQARTIVSMLLMVMRDDGYKRQVMVTILFSMATATIVDNGVSGMTEDM